MLAVTAAVAFGSTVQLLAQTPWYVRYEDALTAQGRREWSRSVSLLKEALAEKSGERLKAKTYGLRFVNYLPYYSLGVAYYYLQDRQNALACFDSSLSQKAILDAPDEYARLQSLRMDLLSPMAANPPTVGARPGGEDTVGSESRPHAPRPAAQVAAPLNAGEQNDMLPVESPTGLTWYDNYETGLAYIESGDWLKAAENLRLALSANAIPHRYARTYGMWFIRYIPYYFLGIAYYNQGLWERAANYFEVSQRFEETKGLSVEESTLVDLLAQARSKQRVSPAHATPGGLTELVSAELAEGIRSFNRREFDDAEKHFKTVERLDPYNSVAKSYMGRILARNDRAAPTPGGTHEDFADGVLQLLRGKHDRAIELFSRSEVLMEHDASYHAYVGVAYALRYRAKGKKDAGALRTAQNEFRRALAIDPHYQLDDHIFSRDVITLFQNVRKAKGK
jgi:tetratricopeptide (TPR) repeat protein